MAGEKVDIEELAEKIIRESKEKEGGDLIKAVTDSVDVDKLRDKVIDKALADPELSSKIISELISEL